MKKNVALGKEKKITLNSMKLFWSTIADVSVKNNPAQSPELASSHKQEHTRN